jgi:UDP-3-O-acyl-N-acetylglucosamine deacetylase
LDAAAWRYFGHSAEDLSWAESAMLAVLPNAPAMIHLSKGRKTLLSKRNRLLKQLLEEEITYENYKSKISKARTFGFDYELEYLKANNLALGGSLDNAIVITKDGVLNPGGLRYEDEFVRHKMLDLIGDLKILNKPIKGHLVAVKAGHAINNDFAKELEKHNKK